MRQALENLFSTAQNITQNSIGQCSQLPPENTHRLPLNRAVTAFSTAQNITQNSIRQGSQFPPENVTRNISSSSVIGTDEETPLNRAVTEITSSRHRNTTKQAVRARQTPSNKQAGKV